MAVKKPVDYSRLLSNVTSGWVLISVDQKRVVAKAKSLLLLNEKIRELGNPKGYIMTASKDYSNYIGCQF